jgi:hypothetical protein
MMAGIHDTCAGDERCAERWNHDDKGTPDFALGIQYMQFCRKVEREVEQAGKRDYSMSVALPDTQIHQHTTTVSGGETLETVLQDVVVVLCTDGDRLQCPIGGVNLSRIDLASAEC